MVVILRHVRDRRGQPWQTAVERESDQHPRGLLKRSSRDSGDTHAGTTGARGVAAVGCAQLCSNPLVSCLSDYRVLIPARGSDRLASSPALPADVGHLDF